MLFRSCPTCPAVDAIAILGAAVLAVGACSSPRFTARHAESTSVDPFRDLLMSPVACETSPRPVTRAEAMEDVAAIERILRRGYAGYEVLARGGLDWDNLFQTARSAIQALSEPIAPSVLRETLSRSFSGLGDNHVALWDYSPDGWIHWKSTGGHDDAYTAEILLAREGNAWVVRSGDEAGSRLEGCTGQQPDAIVRPGVSRDLSLIYRAIVLAREVPAPLDCQLRTRDGDVITVSLPLRRLRIGPVERKPQPIFELHSGPSPRLRLRSLDEARVEGLETFAASAARLRDAHSIVLDLRGNNGGSDLWVTRWFAQLTSGRLSYPTIEELHSEVTVQGDVNTAVCDLASIDGNARADELARGRQDRAVHAIQEAAREKGPPSRFWKTRTPVVTGEAPSAFSGRLVLLADARCASSCETFFGYARQLPGAVTVGENTAGVGSFGDVRLYRLPRSGLGFSAGKKWFHADRGGSVPFEGRGHLPDLWLDTDDAPELAQRLAGCFADGGCAARFRAALGR